MYLLDTDTLSNLLRRRPSTSLVGRLATVPAENQRTSSITVGELLYGAYRAPSGGEDIKARIDRLLAANMRIVPFDTAAARVYGELRANLERQGTPIGDNDTRIAAIALARELTVVTANVRHFTRVAGLLVENWI